MTRWTTRIIPRKASGKPTMRKEKAMKAKLIALIAIVLFELGCGSDWTPVATEQPVTDRRGPNGPECTERFYPGNPLPPHCEPPAANQQ